jgi:hypothetical protein
VVILDVLENIDLVTVVPLMIWIPDRHQGREPPKEDCANVYLTDLPSEAMVFNFRRGKTVHKTELFRMPDGEHGYPVKENIVHKLQALVGKIPTTGFSKKTASDTEGHPPPRVPEARVGRPGSFIY